MKVFLIEKHDPDSWTGRSYILPRVFATQELARGAIGEKSPWWKGNDNPIEPYWTIHEIEVEAV